MRDFSFWFNRLASRSDVLENGMRLLCILGLIVMTVLPSNSVFTAFGQPRGYNYEESKVPNYTLPDLLGGVETAADWPARRAELHALLEREMFGKAPPRIAELNVDRVEASEVALDGKARRRQIRVHLGEGVAMDVLIYLPLNAASENGVPLFLGYNFTGNHTIRDEKEIVLPTSWLRKAKDNQATDEQRANSSRWPVEMITSAGYGLATIYYGDVDPDFDDGWKNGVHQNYPKPGPADWGSIATWAWGLSRALDAFEMDPEIDATKVAVFGHSRLGKTSLWAGANDTRFAMAISNNSGCGGAALSRRAFGETVKRINTSFPHWFCDNYHKYNDKEGEAAFDQHMLIALMAPRPVYVASAVDDKWADPRGEFLSAKHASPAWELLGQPGLSGDAYPDMDTPLADGRVGYHVRTGKHNVTEYDWQQYIDFADKWVK